VSSLPVAAELIPEKVEHDIRIIAPTPIVLAVDDLGLRRMHLKPAHVQPRLKLAPQGFSFLLGPTMHQAVVSIATPWKVGVCPRHPELKRIVQEEIG
jgi:hypothetical protein